ncbi:MAG: nucleoside recognition protein [Verrucomicrobiales bacterium]|nr:nucleoside recognition protein [Verrucomicrobiales bacterium]
MLNTIWLAMLLTAVLVAGITGNVRASVDAAIKAAETAVTLAFGLVGVMSLWLGIMRLAERSGLVGLLARALRPLLVRLFPDVPPDHPAMASMVLNIAANMLGLTNAATPLGLRAMRDLESLNRHPGTATDAMCTFLAINTGSVQLIPASAIAILAASGAAHPTAIVGSTLVATCCSSAAGLFAVKGLQGLRAFRIRPTDGPTPETAPSPVPGLDTSPGKDAISGTPSLRPLPSWGVGVLLAMLLGFVVVALTLIFPEWVGRTPEPGASGQATWIRALNAVSLLAIPALLSFFPLFAALRGLPVYEEFVEGAKEGFQVALRIIPFLVAMLVAIGFLRGAGAIEGFTSLLRGPLEALGFPPELLPISLIRPLSGSASLAAFGDIVKTHGPDSLLARTAGTLFGSTETTFYVIAVYFGSIAVRRVRHAVWAGLAADAAGVVAAVVVCRWMFPGA